MTETFLWESLFSKSLSIIFHFQLLNYCKLFYPKKIVPYGGVGAGDAAGVGAGVGVGVGAGVGAGDAAGVGAGVGAGDAAGVGAGVGPDDGTGVGAGVGCVVGGPTPPPLCAAALSATIKATIVGAV